jgi:hypothetical protein
MSTLKKVDVSRILQKAMSIVNLAKKEILATMDLAEEIQNPLPLEYFFLLGKKVKSGIKVTRLAFGTQVEFKKFNKACCSGILKHKNYKCFLTSSKNYKRMLMVDKKYLIFAINKNGIKNFFYVEDARYINKFYSYFKREQTVATLV